MITAFGSLDDMFESMRNSQMAADDEVVEWQKKVKIGDFVVRDIPALGVTVYAEILDAVAMEREAAAREEFEDEEGTEEAVRHVQQTYAQPHMEHFRFTRSYSPMCEDGELGDVHISTLVAVISAEQFAAAKVVGWPRWRLPE